MSAGIPASLPPSAPEERSRCSSSLWLHPCSVSWLRQRLLFVFFLLVLQSHGERDPVAHPSPFLLKEIISDDTVFLRLSHVPFIPVEGGEIALDAQPGARE